MGASLRYLSQRYIMPYKEIKGVLTDIGTEELGHIAASGMPFTVNIFQSKGDTITDLTEDLAADGAIA